MVVSREMEALLGEQTALRGSIERGHSTERYRRLPRLSRFPPAIARWKHSERRACVVYGRGLTGCTMRLNCAHATIAGHFAL